MKIVIHTLVVVLIKWVYNYFMTKFHFYILMSGMLFIMARLDTGIQFYLDIFFGFVCIGLAIMWARKNNDNG